MATTWADAVKHQFCQQLRQQNLRNRFIGKHKLQEIWRTTFQNQLEVAPDFEVRYIRDCLLDDQDDQRLLILASILVYIDWNDWHNFQNLFTDGHGKVKAQLQLPLNEDIAYSLVGTKGPNFCDSQPIFLPVTIVQGENLHISEWDRLPFAEKQCTTSAGVSGTVTKIVVERGYFEDSNGERNQQQRILARKRFHYPGDYTTEIRFLNEIRSNLRQHSHVLAHMSTLAIGTNDFSILSEFADRGDLQQFLVGPFSGYKTYRDRIIEETAKIANALDFLHKGFHVDGIHRPCYHLDLKPANILIFTRRHYPPDKRDDIGEWVITDFGVSVFHERSAEGASTTLPRREPGTYQPPEIDDRLGSPRVNGKGDIWSLGGILCMVLAFLLDGRHGVEDHVRRRSRTAVGPQEQDFYYEVTAGPKAKAFLKSRIHEWLMEIRGSSTNVVWVTGMIDLIQCCLNVDDHERPNAIQVYKSLLQPQNGNRLRLTKSMPPILPQARPAPVNSPPSPSLRRTVRNMIEPFHHRSHSKNHDFSQQTRRVVHRTSQPGGGNRNQKLQPTAHRSSSSSSQNAPQQLSLTTRSVTIAFSPLMSSATTSTASLSFISGSVETIVRRGYAKHVVCDPGGQSVVLCFSQEALIFGLVPNVTQRSVMGTFDYINLAGRYLILYEASSLQPKFEDLGSEADASFAKLAEESSRFRTAFKTAVSACGEVVLIQPRILRAPKYLSVAFEMPAGFGHEKFQGISFDRTGSHLWACGSRHWFMWDVDSNFPGWLLQPRVGSFTVQQDWQATSPSIFTFNERKAMCLYNDKTHTLRLFDAWQNTSTSVPVETSLLCAIIGCHDDQIFYIRLSKSPHRLGLYRRAIQGMRIGTEVPVTAEMSGFSPQSGFTIGCRDEGSAQVLVIVSTEGKYQSHRLDFEEPAGLT